MRYKSRLRPIQQLTDFAPEVRPNRKSVRRRAFFRQAQPSAGSERKADRESWIGLSVFRGPALRSFLKTKRRPPLRLYNSQRWRNLRRHQRRIEPLCRFCKQRGINTPGTIVDHVIPWRGDANAFFTGELQTLCDACHFRIKQQAELLGYRLDAGLDGWPIDPKHPANRPRPSLRLVLANEIDTT